MGDKAAARLGGTGDQTWINLVMAVILALEATSFAFLGFHLGFTAAVGELDSIALALELFVVFLVGSLLMYAGAFAFWRAARGMQIDSAGHLVIAVDTVLNALVAGVALVKLWGRTPIPTRQVGPQIAVFMLAGAGTLGRIAWAIRDRRTRRES